MHRIIYSIIVGVVVPSLARADVMILPPKHERFVNADVVTVGKVIGLEPIDLVTTMTPDSEYKFRFRIAIVKVSETLVGNKKADTLRVAFVPADEKRNPIGFGKYPELNFHLAMGQEGLMFLKTHPVAKLPYGRLNHDFVPRGFDTGKEVPVGRAVVSYDSELKKARATAKVFDDPMKSLRADEPADRWLATACLILRYRTPSQPKAKTEPLGLEESQRILTNLLEIDWLTKRDRPTPWECFRVLDLTPQDSWIAPKQFNNQNELRDHIRVWHGQQGQRYQIRRFVAAK
ncbi:MAG: hypothetical protein EXS16_16830 [Gemmataceae bacterium]|nr:hypothetical protein [Gemmataceae bacterium]